MAGDIDMTNLAKDILQKYVIDSNVAVEFKLVRSSEDIEDEKTSFKPDMSHQIYGDSEQIFGYHGLRVKLYYSACRLTTYLSHTFLEKVDSEKYDGVQPDDILKPIAERIPTGYITNVDDFIHSLDKDSTFKPFGELKHSFTLDMEDGSTSAFEVYYHDISPSGFAAFHERIQLFLLWYIDASSFIDADDEKWRFFLIYEKYTISGNTHYAFAGYSTVYEYYAYPAHVRPRISQMLVLPPFQGIGLGTELIQTIYMHFCSNSDVLDITVEDPSPNFQRLRDLIDAKNFLKMDCFQGSLDTLSEGTIKRAQKDLKINKKQTVRVFEILRLLKINRNNEEEYRKYRLMVKNRLNEQFRKEDSDVKKLQKVLSPDELAATLSITSREQRIETLDSLYKALEEQYEHVLKHLNE